MSEIEVVSRKIEHLEKERAEAKLSLENATWYEEGKRRVLLESATTELKGLRDKEAALIHERATVAGAKEKDWSDAPFYSKRLAKIGFVTPGEQYNTCPLMTGAFMAVGYSVNSFVRAREVFKMSNCPEGSEQWLLHKAKAWVTTEEAKNGQILIKRFQWRGSLALLIPVWVLGSWITKFSMRRKT
ncbi:hypothetical protein BCR33DRAFT_857209 [Rhizoclosmatium globosum]|uniref:Uncharacterized protein n=1 Tax=Rhizoclosmatium globosum TaxID=329046 RepID=A0A1Y2B894_9FUNG|nr:hypothetical protein BCR33DRAFT_857209 [Rhizoclosmatium globosum]|eukprot:ORY30964.1 hypothetical protein BCR33DRAFT_857209 [Rhizoclosmatium globosum]